MWWQRCSPLEFLFVLFSLVRTAHNQTRYIEWWHEQVNVYCAQTHRQLIINM